MMTLDHSSSVLMTICRCYVSYRGVLFLNRSEFTVHGCDSLDRTLLEIGRRVMKPLREMLLRLPNKRTETKLVKVPVRE